MCFDKMITVVLVLSPIYYAGFLSMSDPTEK